MSSIPRLEVAADTLELPECPTPRPGSEVVWYRESIQMSGVLEGYDVDFQPVISTPLFGQQRASSHDAIRLKDRTASSAPNWTCLASSGLILKPTADEADQLASLLQQTVPSAPRHIDLINEIWLRGYEVFVVGGSVRDVLAGLPTNDVDLVTTMPLQVLHCLVRGMYRISEQRPPRAACRNGHIRVGGQVGSLDPYMDLCVFKHHLPGTADAIFGSDFERDIWHRDFACNSVYYDPINKVFIDPTGRGLDDAVGSRLRTVYNSQVRSAYHIGKVAVRAIKLVLKGFGEIVHTDEEVEALISNLSALNCEQRIGYLRAQIFRPVSVADRAGVFDDVRDVFEQLNAGAVFQECILPYRGKLVGSE
ncbi:hypothetical protein [Amycolatopsis sp. lyj-90]|uniref:hypothetical protein n=1 Tax=Amycolatopsis sp. lyj-90 TaxID=2789285 RepID=UPI00397CB8DC